ncbi:MAG: alpha/beta fold hydrolase [Xanthobacteraceae bacterium]
MTAQSTAPSDPDEPFIDDITVPATDGFRLAATLFLPRRSRNAAVLINSATAVPRKIYRSFASYLAGRGAVVLTYDYRGISGSRPKTLVGFKASMADWATLDMTGAIAWMRQRYGDWPLGFVGHSFGGQGLGLAPNNTEVARALLVAAQAGYWGLMTPPERYRVYAFMNFVGVPLTRMLGYAPGFMGLGEDLPKDAFLQWTAWVMSRHYMFDDANLPALANFPTFKGRLRAHTFTDDPWATPSAVELLCSHYTGTAPEIVKLAPADVGTARIGHFGFFRPEQQDGLWRGAADWLLAE